MSKQLPPRPSLEQLKKQAKDLRKAHQSGDADAIGCIREHLPRLAQASDDEIRAAEIVLQEAQHVVACEYGFKNWTWLQAVVERDLDVLARLTDREIQTLLLKTDQKDLVVSLKGASDEVKEKLVGNMSERVRTFITEEMEFLGPIPHTEIEEAQRRAMAQAAQLAAEGQVDWPNGRGPMFPQRETSDQRPGYSSRLLELVGKPLEVLGLDEVVELWAELAEQARREGMLSLEGLDQQVVDPFVREAMRLAVDGTQPDLIQDILETRSQKVMLPQQETQGRMVIEALMAIQSGDNPRIIRHKMSTFYQAVRSGEDGGSGKVTVEQLQGRLRESLGGTPLARMEFDQIAELFTDLGALARRAGIAALGPLVEIVDGPLCKRGLQMAVDGVHPDEVMGALEGQLDEELRQARARQRMVIAGIGALQMGMRPVEVEEKVRQAAS